MNSLGRPSRPAGLHRTTHSRYSRLKFQVREKELAETTLLTDGGIRFWILCEPDSPIPLCACETFNRKRGLVKSPGAELREVPVIGVASVFTPAPNRGKGHAGLMMRLLADKAREIAGNHGFSVLFSDVGPTFYAKNGGWVTCDAGTLVIPSDKSFQSDVSAEDLTLESARRWIEEDQKALREEFSGEEGRTVIQMIPQHSELEWAALRDRHGAENLKLDTSEVVGSQVSNGNDWGYVLWFHEWKDSSLTVLRLREPSSDVALIALIESALSEARRSGMRKLTIWSPSDRLVKAAGIPKIERKSSLPALLYMDEGRTVKWRSIEKLGWC
jgi:hypothetical protein